MPEDEEIIDGEIVEDELSDEERLNRVEALLELLIEKTGFDVEAMEDELNDAE